MSRLSGALPITLYQNYKQIPFSAKDACRSCFPAFDGAALRCTDPRYPIIEAVYSLGNRAGSSQSEIVSAAQAVCGNFSADAYHTAFKDSLRRGLLTSVVPPCINYVTGNNGPSRYILAPGMDQYPANSPYVKFLLWLVGGYNSPRFTTWFTLTCAPGTSTCPAPATLQVTLI